MTVSPDHGWRKHRYPHGFCRFYPSCSEYGYLAVEKYGVFRGMSLAAWRVVRCNPWSRGGMDPLR
jgi:hypothetical protein